MLVIRATNVNDALSNAVDIMRAIHTDHGSRNMWRKIAPRNGAVTYEYREPVATVYSKPWQRVLFSEVRDANPFFHLMESLWMLAGRNDAAWISQFSSKISQFAEDDGKFWGAYGKRWRAHFTGEERGFYDPAFCIDQLDDLITLLKREPHTRRAVLAMWDPAADLCTDVRDLPCNTHIYFKIRDDTLNMTVCNRSNDIVLGCYGANAVHFSVLHEFMANAVGVFQGTYTQVSDSWHFYEDNPFIQKVVLGNAEIDDRGYYSAHGKHPRVACVQMVSSEPTNWLKEDLDVFMSDDWNSAIYVDWFFKSVAVPMRRTWNLYKKDRSAGFKDLRNAMLSAAQICAPDWKLACVEWLQRRVK